MNIEEILMKLNTITDIAQELKEKIADTGRNTENIINKYLSSNAIKKLHLGARETHIDGWLATDIDTSHNSNTAYLDASKSFPFTDNIFDYIYSEHMIEHLEANHGICMLKECYRVLKPNGRIRIATPDLSVVVDLYDRSKSKNNEYINFIADLTGSGIRIPSFIINTCFRAFGHKFLYDGEFLSAAMQAAGFVDISRYEYGESHDHNLKGIECHAKVVNNNDMASFETMIYEGRKAAY